MPGLSKGKSRATAIPYSNDVSPCSQPTALLICTNQNVNVEVVSRWLDQKHTLPSNQLSDPHKKVGTLFLQDGPMHFAMLLPIIETILRAEGFNLTKHGQVLTSQRIQKDGFTVDLVGILSWVYPEKEFNLGAAKTWRQNRSTIHSTQEHLNEWRDHITGITARVQVHLPSQQRTITCLERIANTVDQMSIIVNKAEELLRTTSPLSVSQQQATQCTWHAFRRRVHILNTLKDLNDVIKVALSPTNIDSHVIHDRVQEFENQLHSSGRIPTRAPHSLS